MLKESLEEFIKRGGTIRKLAAIEDTQYPKCRYTKRLKEAYAKRRDFKNSVTIKKKCE